MPRPSARCCARTMRARFTIILVDDDSNDGTADIARRSRGGAECGRAPADHRRTAAAARLDRQAVGGQAGRRGGAVREQSAGLPPAVRCRHRLRAGGARRSGGARGVQQARAHLADGEAALRKLCRAQPHSGVHLLLPDALSRSPWVNKPAGATAAAAGGCMLVRSDALKAAGGIDAIRNALIDDCSLAKLLKAQGPIWLGLTERVRSIRPYPDFEDIRRMVSRSAYAQLRYSPLLLAGTVVGMALTYLAPPLLALFASGPARWLGLLAWAPDGGRVPADAAALRTLAPCGDWPCRPSPCATCCSPSIQPCNSPAARADCGRGAYRPWNHDRTIAAALRSGKGHRDENFPVASRLIHPRHRGAILAFYEFVRVADDIADHATLRRAREARLPRPPRSRPARPERRATGGGRAADGLARAQPVAAPCPGPLDGLPDGCDQTALSRLGRPDGLLQLLGHAGRPLRARRAWRGPLDLAGQ